jgi:hypothetical protein
MAAMSGLLSLGNRGEYRVASAADHPRGRSKEEPLVADTKKGADKRAEKKAYDAGRSLVRAQFPEDMPAEKKKLGEHHNPFDERDQPEEYQAWLRGLRDSLLDQGDADERAALLKRLEGVS